MKRFLKCGLFQFFMLALMVSFSSSLFSSKLIFSSLATAEDAGKDPLENSASDSSAKGKSHTSAASPIEEVQSTVNEIIKAVQDYPGAAHLKERRTKLREIITPKFDFEEMARRSLGSNWNECSPEEQSEFVKVFSELLAKTYLNKIENVRSDMVKVDSEQIRDDLALVRTTVTDSDKRDSFALNYKLLKRELGWRVYDVIIEDIGLVANYRNEFAGIIRKEKFSGLLKKLKEKGEG